MLKFIWSLVFALIIFGVVRGPLIPYISSNQNIVAILVIFTVVIINSWIIDLIVYIRKRRLN
ncbi:hypothetical protein [Bacillus cereus group sp. N21]|uniref:hypothetical protein n=1 Tax=Bacillus cereus group sp. N21 TaxID=2794591 RepID=UPI0018F44DB6|nr:hypothetical protein [Bacillus cereus group sp. N21]MBJ8030468.1 hypothetical protein [Bacillus cereus group sp. N21]